MEVSITGRGIADSLDHQKAMRCLYYVMELPSSQYSC